MGRTAKRRAANMANRRISASAWFYGQSFTSATRDPQPSPLFTCPTCKKQVFTTVEGYCSSACRPAEGRNVHDWTPAQAEERHACGILNRQHVDGWDGNWLDCEEALMRNGVRRETFSEIDARIVSDMLHDID